LLTVTDDPQRAIDIILGYQQRAGLTAGAMQALT
jgi:hypothetical protein